MLRVLLGLFVFTILASVALSQETAIEIIERSDQVLRGVNSSQGEMKMTIVRPNWTREVSMKSWTKGQDFNLILITSPSRDKGTSFLKRDRDLWNWQPTIERTVKLPPSMLSQGWMGSDLTNDDLVKQASVVEDYIHSILGSEVVDKRECWKIQMTPKEDAPVVWGRVVTWIDKVHYLQLRSKFYDEDDYLINTIYGRGVKKMSGKTLTSILEVVPADNPDQKTIVEYLNIVFDKEIKDSFFSIQNMKRVK